MTDGKFLRHPVARVLRRDGCGSHQPRVMAEGAFLQLAEDGRPIGHVFLGITHADLVVVKQDNRLPNLRVPVSDDAEICDLVLGLIFPLSVLKFFVLDDRAKRFTVFSSFGNMLYYEMCQVDSNFEKSWLNWTRVVKQISQHKGNRPTLWRSDTALGMKSYRSALDKSLLKSACEQKGRILYIHQPSTDHQGTGDQTQTGYDVSDSDSSSSDVTTQPGERPSGRLRMLTCQYAMTSLETAEYGDQTLLPTRSCSWTDVLDDNDTIKVDIPDTLKVLKRSDTRNRGTLEEILDNEDHSDPEDNIDAFIQEFKANKEFKAKKNRGRPGLSLWRETSRLVLKKPQTADVFQQMVFKTMAACGMPKSLERLDPRETALALTAISKKVLMTLRPIDIQLYSATKGRKIPQRLAAVLECGHSISKMATNEILRQKSILDRSNAIKRLIEVCADLLFHQHDFQSFAVVLAGLTSLPVYRLDSTWLTLFVDAPVTFRKFLCIMKILSPKGHYVAYSKRIRGLQAKGIPFLPWLDHFLQHCKHSRYTSYRVSGIQGKPGQHLSKWKKVGIVSRFRIGGKTDSNDKLSRINSKHVTKPPKNEPGKNVVKSNQEKTTKDVSVNNTDTTRPIYNTGNGVKLKSILKKQRKPTLCFPCRWRRKSVRFSKEVAYECRDSGSNMKNLAKTKLPPGLKLGLVPKRDKSKKSRSKVQSKSKRGAKARHIKDSTRQVIERYSAAKAKEIITSALLDLPDYLASTDSSDGDSESSYEESESSESVSSDEDEFSTAVFMAKRNKPKAVANNTFAVSLGYNSDENNEHSGPRSSARGDPAHSDTSLPLTVPEAQRRMSYVPSVIQGRRKSLFEEVARESDTRSDDTSIVFEQMKNEKLNTAKKKGPAAFALLDDEDSLKPNRQKGLRKTNKTNNSHSDGKEIAGKRHKDRSGDKNKQASRKRNNVEKSNRSSQENDAAFNRVVGRPAKEAEVGQNRLYRSSSLDNLVVSLQSPVSLTSGKCSLCSMSKCIYMSDKRKQLLQFQSQALKIKPRAKKSVESYIQNALKVNSLLSEFDILQISLPLD